MEPLSEADLLLAVYVLVDDWVQAKEKTSSAVPPRPGPAIGGYRGLSLSEMLALLLAIDLMDFDSERRFVAHLRANHAALFSAPIPDHSWLNRCGRRLAFELEPLRQKLASDLRIPEQDAFAIDTTPVEVVGYKRSKASSDFAGTADYGYCAALKKRYFGYKLVVLSTLGGLPAAFDLVAASADERAAAGAVLPFLSSAERLQARRAAGLTEMEPSPLVFGDKGFIGEDWALEQEQQLHGAQIMTPRRRNQRRQWPKAVAKLINRRRQRIETLNAMLKNGARNAGKTLAKTVQGLCSRLMARFAALTARHWLKRFWGIDTFYLTWTAPAS